jgi:hypothetical protein
MTGNVGLEKKAEELIRAFLRQVQDHPMVYTQLLAAIDFMVGPNQEIVVAGDPALETTQTMLSAIQKKFLPNKVLLLWPQGADSKRLTSLSPFVKAMAPMNYQPTVYICEQYACQASIKDFGQLESALD